MNAGATLSLIIALRFLITFSIDSRVVLSSISCFLEMFYLFAYFFLASLMILVAKKIPAFFGIVLIPLSMLMHISNIPVKSLIFCSWDVLSIFFFIKEVANINGCELAELWLESRTGFL